MAQNDHQLLVFI